MKAKGSLSSIAESARNAAAAGLGIAACPHEPGTVAAIAWNRTWMNSPKPRKEITVKRVLYFAATRKAATDWALANRACGKEAIAYVGMAAQDFSAMLEKFDNGVVTHLAVVARSAATGWALKNPIGVAVEIDPEIDDPATVAQCRARINRIR